jgi:hypothetical protein
MSFPDLSGPTIGTVGEPFAFHQSRILSRRFSMRVSHIAVLAAVLAIPSVAHAQQDGPVGGKVGSDLSSSTTQPSLAPSARAYAPLNPTGRAAGYAGATTPGQVLPDDVQVTPRSGGMGSAYVNGHRVLVDPSNRILRVIN